MYIEKISITTFGKLTDFELALSPGVNIIEGANESGKSTIAAFIKFMFYGAASKERSSLVSWNSGGAAGSLTLNTGNHRYRIERALICTGSSGKVTYRETVQLIDLANNTPCHKGECPGELFFGVDADMFAATAFVSQLDGTDVGGSKIVEGIENLMFSADETVNTQRALSKLDSARALLLHKNEKGGKLFELEKECASLEAKLASALEISSEILAKEAQLADVRKNETASREKAMLLEKKIEQFEARTVIKLFERLHLLEDRVQEIKKQIDESGAPDPEYVNRLRVTIERINQLRNELNDATIRLENSAEPSVNPKLDEYLSKGGREGIESERASLRSGAKSYLTVAVIFTLLAVGVLSFGLLPVISSSISNGSPILWAVICGVLFAAFAVTMFVLGSKHHRQELALINQYDIEQLEAELEKRQSAEETAKLAVILKESAETRLSEALNEAVREYEIENESDNEIAVELTLEKLKLKLDEMIEKSRATEDLKNEYDKVSAVYNGLHEQLIGYNENEFKDKIDLTIDISDIDTENLQAIRREASFASKSAISLNQHAAELEKALAGMYPTAENPTKINDRLEAVKLERDKLEKKLAAYKLAYEKLTEASINLRESVSPRLASDAAGLMNIITSGKYSELGVGSTLEMSAATESGSRSIELLSAGTQDAAYICLRLALIGLLYRKCIPPTIYDESFSRLDDTRLKRLLKIISTQEQSIILTSNNRDRELMTSVGEFKSILI